MSKALNAKLIDLSVAIADSLKATETRVTGSISAVNSSIRGSIGELSNLVTATKTNIVAAINEVHDDIVSGTASLVTMIVQTSTALQTQIGSLGSLEESITGTSLVESNNKIYSLIVSTSTALESSIASTSIALEGSIASASATLTASIASTSTAIMTSVAGTIAATTKALGSKIASTSTALQNSINAVGTKFNEIYITGQVVFYAGKSIPDGWLLCSGAPVSRATYSALDSVIGTTFGNYTTVGGVECFYLPSINDARFIEGGTPGTYYSPGLPNLYGTFGVDSQSLGSLDGMLFKCSVSSGYGGASGQSWYNSLISFDANRRNSIYGNSTTVQPKAITLYPIIKT